MRKATLVILSMIVLATFIYAVSVEIKTFDNQDNPFYILINASENSSIYYLSIPMYSYLMNLSLSMDDNQSFFQEDANYTSHDYTGNPTPTWEEFFDGDWTNAPTDTSQNNYYFSNYTIPNGVSAAEWLIHASIDSETPHTSNTTLSIPYDCLNISLGNVSFKTHATGSPSDQSNWYCWNDTLNDWALLTTLAGKKHVFEEAILWYYDASNVSIYIDENRVDIEQLNQTNVSINVSHVNDILEDGCTCSDCTISGTDCLVPFKFYSKASSYLQINLTNATYAYALDNCVGNFDIHSTISTLNISFRDEGNSSYILTDIDSTFNYTIDLYNYTAYELDTTGVVNLSICIYPSWGKFTTDYSIFYSAEPSYPERRYTTSEVLDSSTLVKTLYLLYAGEGIYVRFKTVDEYDSTLVGTTIDMATGGSTIEQQTTDDSGLATFWVDPDTDYIFTFTKTGYETQTKSLRPTTSEIYSVVMPSEGEDINKSTTAGVSYNFLPDNIVLGNNTEYEFAFNLTSYYWDITSCTLYLKNSSDDLLASSSASYNTSECNIAITLDTINYTQIVSEAIWIQNSSVSITYKRTYAVIDTYKGEFSLMNFIDDLTAFTQAGFNARTRMIIAFIIIFAVVALVSKYMSVANPEAMVILTMVLVLFFSYIGWLTYNNPNIPTIYGFDIKQYAIFIIIFLLGSSYIIWRHQT